MSQSFKSVIRNSALILGGIGLIAFVYVTMAQILRVEAFAKFQSDGTPIGEEIGIELTNFEMNSYEAGRLASTSVMDSVSIRRDRTEMSMVGVHDGRIYTADGETYEFEAKSALYQYFVKKLSAEEGAHIIGENMDLVSTGMEFDENSGVLIVSGEVTGQLQDGELSASDVSVDTKNDVTTAHDITWIGEIQDPADDKRREWEFHAEVSRSTGDDVTVYENARATDGELIIVAQNIEHNRETDVMVATGDVKYWGLDANMKCEKATVFRDERRIVLEGIVTMFIKSEDDEILKEEEILDLTRAKRDEISVDPQGATDEQVESLRSDENLRKFPTKVIADQVEYWYRKGERHAVITGNPYARQDLPDGWRLGWSDSAYYDGEAETMTLKSSEDDRDVFLFLSVGDWFEANEATFSTKDEVREWTGKNVRATVYIKEDDESSDGGG